ncbi:MAG: YdeI/OmpD-associated family protein [Candidatus Moranbacteria bacterium]|nr:YdeI/OmpD-associated family protein [Candidatus Moranbacteria bacterium]
MDKIYFFKTQSDLRAWFVKHHDKLTEAWIGFYKKDSGKPSIDWNESVDEALCFGWIDGLRKSIDAVSYKIRFTPRRKNSIWSKKNIVRVKELISLKLMTSPGLKVFEKRDEAKTDRYSFEQDQHSLGSVYEKKFKKNTKAWKLFQSMPPSYQKPAIWWVVSAKQGSTREKRVKLLIECSQNNERIPAMRRIKK